MCKVALGRSEWRGQVFCFGGNAQDLRTGKLPRLQGTVRSLWLASGQGGECEGVLCAAGQKPIPGRKRLLLGSLSAAAEHGGCLESGICAVAPAEGAHTQSSWAAPTYTIIMGAHDHATSDRHSNDYEIVGLG